MTAQARSGVALLEVLAIGVLATLLAIPIYNAIMTSGHEAMTSEDYRLAEVVAQRAVGEELALDWDKLARSLPVARELKGVPAGDAQIVKLYPEYARIFASQGFTGQLSIRVVSPDLLSIEAHLTWPVRPGSSSRRSYSIFRLRARSDAAIRATWPISRGVAYTVDETEIAPTQETP